MNDARCYYILSTKIGEWQHPLEPVFATYDEAAHFIRQYPGYNCEVLVHELNPETMTIRFVSAWDTVTTKQGDTVMYRWIEHRVDG